VRDLGLRAEDFYKPAHGHIYASTLHLLQVGSPVDVVTVADELRRVGLIDEVGGLPRLLELQAATPAFSAAHRYARIVADCAMLRRLISVSSEIADLAYVGSSDSRETVERAKALLAARTVAESTDQLEDFWLSMGEAFVGLDDRDTAQPWVHNGVVRVGQRLGIVAPPGVGKSFLMSQFAWCAENGVHALTGCRVAQPSTRSLVVELEGSRHDVAYRSGVIKSALVRLGIPSRDLAEPAFLWRQGGIDLANESGYILLRRALQAIVRGDDARPGQAVGMVCIGPQKYFGLPDHRENYEQHASRVQANLNQILSEFQCAIVVEVHANASGAVAGSERWKNWPDIGWELVGEDDQIRNLDHRVPMRLGVDRYRQPRDTSAVRLKTLWRNQPGHPLPWTAADDRERDGRSTHDHLNRPHLNEPAHQG
jgi:hypothetical protein